VVRRIKRSAHGTMTTDPDSSVLPSGGFPLPTLDHLGVKAEILPSNPADAREIATKWFDSFSAAATESSIEAITKLFHQECYWRDILALTWDFRTFTGPARIKQFLNDRLKLSQLKSFNLQYPEHISVQQPYPDLAWIQFMFSFVTGDVGICSGIGRLIPIPSPDGSVEWKCHCMFTHLEDLQGHPEKIGSLRNQLPSHGVWASQRRKEMAFEDKDPVVVIIGGSQSGLTVAARLKMLDVPTLIVDKFPRIGDNWRNRYNALCLHDPICEFAWPWNSMLALNTLHN